MSLRVNTNLASLRSPKPTSNAFAIPAIPVTLCIEVHQIWVSFVFFSNVFSCANKILYRPKMSDHCRNFNNVCKNTKKIYNKNIERDNISYFIVLENNRLYSV